MHQTNEWTKGLQINFTLNMRHQKICGRAFIKHTNDPITSWFNVEERREILHTFIFKLNFN